MGTRLQPAICPWTHPKIDRKLFKWADKNWDSTARAKDLSNRVWSSSHNHAAPEWVDIWLRIKLEVSTWNQEWVPSIPAIHYDPNQFVQHRTNQLWAIYFIILGHLKPTTFPMRIGWWKYHLGNCLNRPLVRNWWWIHCWHQVGTLMYNGAQ